MQKYNLTTPQKNIWNLQKYYENTSISNICGAVIFEKNYETSVIETALNIIIEKQEGLRLRFCYEGDKVMQYIAEFSSETFEKISFASEDELDRFADSLAKKPMKMIDSKMYRFVIFELEGKIGIILCANHLISDAWTFSLLASNVASICEENPIIDRNRYLTYSYKNFIFLDQEYYTSKRFVKDREFWREEFSKSLLPSYIKNEISPATTPDARRYVKTISEELTSDINKFCNNHNIRTAVLFESALFIYLSKINQENESIVIGNLVLNRDNINNKRTAGMFISTIPLKIDIVSENSVLEVIKNVTSKHMKVFRHQKYPYDQIKEIIHSNNVDSNIIHAVFSFQNAQTNIEAKTKWYYNGASEVPFYMHVDNRDGLNTYSITIDYQECVFSKAEIDCIFGRYINILRQIINNINRKIAEIQLLTSEERNHILFNFNATSVEYDSEKCVHELFVTQARTNPEKLALIFESKKITYRQLDEMSNSIAHYLRIEKGIHRNDIIPIIANRSWLFYVAMLGILKAGGAFLSIESNFPTDRICYMLNECKAKVVLSNAGFKDANIDVIDMTDFDYSSNKCELNNINESDDLCYVIYTSGSTGKPKGLMISHKNAVNFSCKNSLNVMGYIIPDNNYSFLSITNTIFDMFITECILTMANGLTVILANQKETVSQELLNIMCQRTKPDIIETTPSKLKILMSDENLLDYIKDIKIFILGGEEMTDSFYAYLKERTKGIIFNNYGPAETTVWSTIKKVNQIITIGKPIANTQIYILDKNRKPLPIGIAGELCISGDGVGKGYLNNPELTAEKFIPNPFIKGKTMYCTGDLARWRADGEIEFLGRIDTQVKIRGLRIELGEIESVMSSIDGIELCAVTDKRDENNRQYLVGYYTANKEIDEKAIRAHLSAKLPKYMVPNYFVHLDNMPMTPSGKIDRKVLPTPEFTQSQTEFVAPRNRTEEVLCSIVGELLKVEKTGITDDFFDLGGDSLAAIEYVTKAAAQGITIAMQDVFDYPTVKDLCEHLEKSDKTAITYDPSDFDKYRVLLDKNRINNRPHIKKLLGNIFLTGATGFLGAHILDYLMHNETGKIYCLVRSNSADDRRGSWPQLLTCYFGDKYEKEYGKRIIPIIGDIEYEKLSDSIPDDVQTIIHTAATVKHYGSYSYFDKINVQGTKNVIRYAQRIKAKLIHISTISVSGNSFADAFEINKTNREIAFDETCIYVDQPLENVYVRSKFEAERAVLDAMLEGLDAKIIRVGNLTNRASDLKFQPNYQSNAFLTRVKAGLEFGVLPDYLLDQYVEFSPIDKTAEGVVKIAEYADDECVFHLNNEKGLYFDKLIAYLNKVGIKMNTMEGSAFNQALRELAVSQNTEYIYEAFQNDLGEDGRLQYDSNIHIVNDFTVKFLRDVGFEWPEIDYDYISRYVTYFRDLGYLNV